jgi:hypothetical protein
MSKTWPPYEHFFFFLNELSQANNIPDSLTMLSAFKRMFEKLRLKKMRPEIDAQLMVQKIFTF